MGYRQATSSRSAPTGIWRRNDDDPSLDEYRLLESFGLPRRDYEWEVMQDGLRRAFGLPEFTVERESDPAAEGSQRFRVASASAEGGPSR